MPEQLEEWPDVTTILMGDRSASPITERIIQASPLEKEVQQTMLASIARSVEPAAAPGAYYLCEVDDVEDKRILLSPRSDESIQSRQRTTIAVTPDTYNRMNKAGNIQGSDGVPIPAGNVSMIKALLFLRQEASHHTGNVERYLTQFCDRVQVYMGEKVTTVEEILSRVQEDMSQDSRDFAEHMYMREADTLRQATALGSEIFSEVSRFFDRVHGINGITHANADMRSFLGFDRRATIPVLPDFYLDGERKALRLPLSGQMERREISASRSLIELIVLGGTALSVYQTAGTPFVPRNISVAGTAYELAENQPDETGSESIVYKPVGMPQLPDVRFSSADGRVVDSIHLEYQTIYPGGVVTEEVHSFMMFGSLIAEGTRISMPNTHEIRIGLETPDEITLYHRKLHNEAYQPPQDVRDVRGREWVRVFAGNMDPQTYVFLQDPYPDGVLRMISLDHEKYIGRDVPGIIDVSMQFMRGVRVLDYTPAYALSFETFQDRIADDGTFWGRNSTVIENSQALHGMAVIRETVAAWFGQRISKLAKGLSASEEADFEIRLLPVKDTPLLSELGIGEVTLSIDVKRNRLGISFGSVAGVLAETSSMVWNGVSARNVLRSELSPQLTAQILSSLASSLRNGECIAVTSTSMYGKDDPAEKRVRKLKDRVQKGKLQSQAELAFLYRHALAQENIVRSSE